MPNEARISRWQVTMIWMGFLIGSTTLVIPSSSVGRDAWISVFLAGVLGLGYKVLLMKLAARFPGKLPAEIFMDCAGRPLGAVLGAVYAWYCFHLGAIVMRNAVEAHFAAEFKRTPQGVVTAVMATLVVIAVYLGIEVFARTTEMLTPLLFLAVFSITVLSIFSKGLLRVESILPVLEHGWVPVLKGTWENFAFPFGETVVLLSVLPYTTTDRRTTLNLLVVGAIMALLLAGVNLRNIMALGPANRILLFPSLTAVSLISIGVLIQRLDAFLLFVWTFGVFIKASLCLFAAVVNLKALLKVKDYRLLTFPCGALMAGLSSQVFHNAIDMVDSASFVWPLYSFPWEVLLPAGIFALAVLRKRGKAKRPQS